MTTSSWTNPGGAHSSPEGTPGGAAERRPAASVLVVDDEPSVSDVLQEFLSSQGYDLAVASNGEEAIRLINERRPEIILTDINLPGLSGLDVMRHAKALDPEVSVIVVTGYASASTAIDALRQGAYDYVTKPFDLDEVLQIVERGIANRRLREINRQLVEELRQKNEILESHEAELRERVELATRQMRTLFEIGQELGANLDLDPRLEVIASRAAELSGGLASLVFLRSADTEELYAAHAFGLDLGPGEKGTAVFLDSRSPIAIASSERRPVRADVGLDGTPFAVAGVSSAWFRSLLAVPLIAEGRVIGVITTLEKHGGFNSDDESFLELFASQAAFAIVNAQLFEHTKSLDRLKSEFVAVVSHEIRTPLTSVKGAVELLSDDRFFQNNDQQRKLLVIAHANSERLLLLINDILDFSKLESASLPMSMEQQRIEPVVEQAAYNLRTLIEERHIHLTLTFAPDLPDLMLDSNRITQVVTNLLSNAIKFSPMEGRIDIATELSDGVVQVAMRDHGEGIADQDLPKLFRKFSQIDSSTTRKAGGTGLGLVICRGIVEQHGGKIWVESGSGQGSTFFFTLPVAQAPLPESAAIS